MLWSWDQLGEILARQIEKCLAVRMELSPVT